mmetsp:Transcript_19711/g.47762  ORF Transcript_19711/g.47762 Transcript_19711/m.47762 type:complete len:265 (+) Transcript_19711:280-1074(+)
MKMGGARLVRSMSWSIFRMLLAAATPSLSGISKSVSRNIGASLWLSLSLTALTSSTPFKAQVMLSSGQPIFVIISSSDCRLMKSSSASTMWILRRCIFSISSLSAVSSMVCRKGLLSPLLPTLSSNTPQHWKRRMAVVPLSMPSDSSRQSPPIAMATIRAMERPRPVPIRASLACTCSNSLKMLCSLSSGMPRPLSLTLISMAYFFIDSTSHDGCFARSRSGGSPSWSAASSEVTDTSTDPFSVILTAFDSRLFAACEIRTLSP